MVRLDSAQVTNIARFQMKPGDVGGQIYEHPDRLDLGPPRQIWAPPVRLGTGSEPGTGLPPVRDGTVSFETVPSPGFGPASPKKNQARPPAKTELSRKKPCHLWG